MLIIRHMHIMCTISIKILASTSYFFMEIRNLNGASCIVTDVLLLLRHVADLNTELTYWL